jgi:hypothetical protein
VKLSYGGATARHVLVLVLVVAVPRLRCHCRWSVRRLVDGGTEGEMCTSRVSMADGEKKRCAKGCTTAGPAYCSGRGQGDEACLCGNGSGSGPAARSLARAVSG